MASRKTVRRDLLGLVVFAALSLGAVSGIFVVKANFDARGYEELSASGALALEATRIEALFLRARRAEKDFLLRKDKKYLALHADILDTLVQSIDRIEANLHEHTNEAENQHIDTLRGAVEEYASHFKTLSRLYISLGLTPDTGLEGELRSAVHGMERSLNEIGVPELQVKMLMMRRHEKDFIMRVDQKYVDRLNERVTEFRAFSPRLFTSRGVQAEVLDLLDTYQTTFNSFAQVTFEEGQTRKLVSASFAQAEPAFIAIKASIDERLAADLEEVARIRWMVLIASAAAVLTTIIVFTLRTTTLTRRISLPLQQTAGAIEQLATGTLDVEPPQTTYGEIEQISDAFGVFKQNILDTRKAEQERLESEQRTRAREAEKERLMRQREKEEEAGQQRRRENIRAREHAIAAEITSVIEACANGDFSQRLNTSDKEGVFAELCEGVNQISDVTNTSLTEITAALVALSKGDLTHQMSGEYSGIFEDIRSTVNSTVARLADIVTQIHNGSVALGGATGEIATASHTLAERTEQTAVSLEDTATAIKELTASVRSTADAASEANDAVRGIKSDTEVSDSLVDRTVEAMHQIQASSSKITQIITLIEDIAFQTNLLALNAGVEAARAGDAGSGFAVVATEVRSLASRSAEAAKEISNLIEESRKQVENGAHLVDQTGSALKSIRASVSEIAGSIEGIAKRAQEQSESISGINSATERLDTATQQNASMFEEATANSQVLKAETENLTDVVAAFKVGSAGAPEQGRNVVGLDRFGPKSELAFIKTVANGSRL